MNISQAAQQTGLSAKQIRDYEKQNLLPETRRSESGYRVYGEHDLQRLRFIRHPREMWVFRWHKFVNCWRCKTIRTATAAM